MMGDPHDYRVGATRRRLAKKERAAAKSMGLARRLLGPKEADIERTCSDLLALDGWRPLKTDPVSDRERGKGFGELGMADRLYLRYAAPVQPIQPLTMAASAQVMWIEWKRPGEKLKPHQVAWHIAERARGALTLRAGVDFEATVDGFIAWYRRSGLNRGRV